VTVPKCDWRIDARRCQESGPGGKRPVERPLRAARASWLVAREGQLAAGSIARSFSGRAQTPQPGAQRGPEARAFVREEQAP